MGADSTNKKGIELLSDIEIFGDGDRTIITIDTTGAGITYDSTDFSTNGKFYPIFNCKNLHGVKIHDLKINGNQRKQINYSNNPYTNASWGDEFKTIPGIMFKSGYNNLVYNVKIDSTQGYGIATV